MSRLQTFVPPRPDAALMQFLVPVNRWLNLHGVPLLRDLPLLGRLPGFSGVADIREWHLPPEHEARLRQALSPRNVSFIGPNHPEFFTDWMIDKELSARYAPQLASWATHTVVNGMGAAMQRFWLRNNLIAQIPGAASQAAKQHSVEWALQGHGVLLHPEGAVGWHADWLAPLFPGIAELALGAHARLQAMGLQQLPPVHIVPVVWKLRFLHDETRAIRRELLWTAARLRLEVSPDADLPQQLFQLLSGVLEREAAQCAVSLPLRHEQSYFDRQQRLQQQLALRLDQLAGAEHASLSAGRRWSRVLRESRSESQRQEMKPLLASWERLQRLAPAAYSQPLLAQEHVAECIKRVRNDYCKGRLRDTLNAFFPRPAGPRALYMRVVEPIDIGHWLREQSDRSATALVAQMRSSMQRELDALLEGLHQREPYWTLPNPLISRA